MTTETLDSIRFWIRKTRKAVANNALDLEAIRGITIDHRCVRNVVRVKNDDLSRFVNSLEDQRGIRFTRDELKRALSHAPSLLDSIGKSYHQLLSDMIYRRYRRKKPTSYRGTDK